MRCLLGFLACAAVLSVSTSAACAQRASASRTDRDAIEAFETGALAAEEERWSDALPAFQRAYALSHSDVALFNVGYVLRALGRFVEAHAAFEEVIGMLDGASERLDEARGYRDEVLGRIAHLRLDGLDTSARYTLFVDGTPRDDAGARPLDLSIDPGERTLSVRRDGFLPFDWQGALTEGSVTPLTIALDPIPRGGSIADEPWFWAVLAGVVVAGAIVIGVVVDDAVQLDPAPGRTVIRL